MDAYMGVFAALAAFRNDAKTFLQICGAAILGPDIAGSFLLLVLQHIRVGVATTLSHATAIRLIPIACFSLGERITWRAVAGTCLAIAGIAVLFA